MQAFIDGLDGQGFKGVFSGKPRDEQKKEMKPAAKEETQVKPKKETKPKKDKPIKTITKSSHKKEYQKKHTLKS